MTLVDMSEASLTTSMMHDLYDLTLGAVGPEGPQGKIGDPSAPGPQGVQGKLGDTGAQGVQGKLGPAGADGIPGAPGESGPVPGKDRFAIALSADQTIGSNGIKFIGLGDTSNTHGVAAIPLPWGGVITDIVGRSLEVCSGVENIVFEVWKQTLGVGPAVATAIKCTVVDGAFNGQGCKMSDLGVLFDELDLVSVKVTNNGCPSTQVSAVIGFASE